MGHRAQNSIRVHTHPRKEVYNIMRRAFIAPLSLLLLVAWCRGASVADNNDTKSNQQVSMFVADLFGEAPGQTDDSKSQQEGSMKATYLECYLDLALKPDEEPTKTGTCLISLEKGAKCLKVQEAGNKDALVSRGCSNPDTTLSDGCHTITSEGIKFDTCYCSKDLCNGATNTASISALFLFCMVMTAFMK